MRNGVPAHEICECARAVERFAAAQAGNTSTKHLPEAIHYDQASAR
jgi:hypothetical protein